jgi:hypothetical protein
MSLFLLCWIYLSEASNTCVCVRLPGVMAQWRLYINSHASNNKCRYKRKLMLTSKDFASYCGARKWAWKWLLIAFGRAEREDLASRTYFLVCLYLANTTSLPTTQELFFCSTILCALTRWDNFPRFVASVVDVTSDCPPRTKPAIPGLKKYLTVRVEKRTPSHMSMPLVSQANEISIIVEVESITVVSSTPWLPPPFSFVDDGREDGMERMIQTETKGRMD